MRLRTHMALAMVAAGLVGALEAGLADAVPGLGRGLPIALAAVFAGLVGALLGATSWAAAQVLGALARAAGRALEPLAGDASRLRRVALVVAALPLAAAYAGGLALVLRRLAAVQDPPLVLALTIAVALVGGALALGLTLALAGLLLRPLAALDRRRPLPWIGDPGRRRLVLVVAPAGALSVAGLALVGARIGPLAWVLVVVLVAALAAALGRLAGRAPRRLRGPLWIVGGLAALTALGLGEARPRAHEGLAATRLPRLGRELVRRALDVDGDGFASALGDRDCAPFDPAISPLARELPGNGIDEDCDGVDGEALALAGAGERFYGLLPARRIHRYNVLWIVVDALRADHVSALGYGKATTPALDAFADEALLFTDALSQSSATMLSIPSMLSGRDPLALEWEIAEGRLQATAAAPTLAERLRGVGYRTGLIVTGYIPRRLPGILRGYETVVDVTPRLGEAERHKTGVVAAGDAIAFLAAHAAAPPAGRDPGPAPFFLTVYFEDPHMPYVSWGAGYPSFGRGALGRYDGEIAATDRQIGVLLDYLRHSPWWDDTIVVITADHGEEFGEHGGTFHARTCHVESVHVPLLVRIPEVAAAVLDQPVALVDVLPTLGELLGLEIGEPLDGQSLLIPALDPGRATPGRARFCAVLSQKASQGHFLREAIRAGDHLLVHEALADRYELYDRRADPGEAAPLAIDDPAHAAAFDGLRRRLKAAVTGNLARRLLTR